MAFAPAAAEVTPKLAMEMSSPPYTIGFKISHNFTSLLVSSGKPVVSVVTLISMSSSISSSLPNNGVVKSKSWKKTKNIS